ncbi:divalent-cation tolerance protein CutA [Nonomuraea maheshkhaliensis]|uniref:Divalent-cation tolerance protein CutA n=1 Tax=Nonomuraea maheshkhaliensis TaxID=419590 RepID=A0ABN2F4W6_9ACTN
MIIAFRLKGNWVVKGFMQVMTTVPSAEEGAALAHSITSQRLAAGVQIIGPIRSLYWWRGALRDEQEWQLVIKTTHALLVALEHHIKTNHSYETPEIIATEIAAGSADYLDWISAETQRIDAS